MTDKETTEPGINFLNACEIINRIVLAPKLERDAICNLVLGGMAGLRLDDLADIVERMKDEGLAFAWVQQRQDEAPYALIDIQQNGEARLLVPPFLYVQVPGLVGLVTINGTYAVFDDIETGEPEQVWTYQYHLIRDKEGYPCYSVDGRRLVSKEKLAAILQRDMNDDGFSQRIH